MGIRRSFVDEAQVRRSAFFNVINLVLNERGADRRKRC
jgi:hypothetical protein